MVLFQKIKETMKIKLSRRQ